MTQYFGDFSEDATVYIPFNTFDSNDPSASVTITNLADADIKVHKDGSATQIVTDGATISIDFDTITGNHLATIDTSAHADYSTGSDYTVRIEGTTVDAATINAWIGTFSIENRHSAGALRPTTAGRTLDVTATGAAGIDWANVENATTAVDLSGTDIQLVDTVTTYTGNTVQTGDSFARLGAPAGASIAADLVVIDNFVDGIETVTDQFAFTVANQVDSNVIAVSGDTTAADNLELMYDGTGYTDETGPASRQQVDNIGAATGASLNYEASADNTAGAIIGAVTIVGSITANLYTDTDVENGTLHQLTHAANAFDFVYRLPIGGGRTAASVEWRGYLTSSNDTCSIQAYDFVGAGWDTISTISGTNGTANATVTASLLSKHTGTGSEIGNVYIRFVCTGQTSPVLNTDQLLVQAVNIGQSVGYANGSVWIDTNNGIAGTEAFVNGVADNPVDLIASAKTLSTSVGIGDFHVINGSSITLAESTTNESYFGDNWSLALAGQTVTGAHFQGAIVSGIAVGAAEYLGCRIGTHTTIANSIYTDCGIEGTITLPTGTVYFEDCRETGTTVLEFGAAVANTTVHMHKHSGAVQLNNFGDNGTDVLELDGNGKLTIDSTSTGTDGTINVHGNWEIIDNSTGGTLVINYDDRPSTYEGGAVWIDTVNGATGQNKHINGTVENPCSAIADAVAIASSTGIPDFHIFNGSSVTLAASAANNSFFGDHWTLALGGQACGGIYVQGATVTGIGTSAGEEMHFEGCDIGTATVEQGHFDKCGFTGTLTMNTADDYEFHGCYDKTAVAAIFTKTAAVNITAEWVDWSGDITLSGIQASSSYILAGTEVGDIILNGADGDVEVRGIYKSITDNRTGSPTLTITGAIKAADVAATLLDTAEIGTAGAGLTDLGGMSTGMKAEINTEVDDVMSVDTHAEIGQETPAATQSMKKMIQFLYKAWRNKSTETATTYSLFNDDTTTVGQQGTVSDDGTTFTVTEKVTG